MLTLRPYQWDAVGRLHAAMAEGCRRNLLVSPTGSGKTAIASHLMLSCMRKGRRALFIAHRREIIDQTFAKLHRECGIPASAIGVMMAQDPRDNPRAPIQVASMDTLINRLVGLAHFDLVIDDEAHTSVTPTRTEALKFLTDRKSWMVLLTATPWRGDGKGLGAIADRLHVVATVKQLIADGWLVEPTAYSVPKKLLPDLAGIRMKGGDYDPEDLEQRCNQSTLVGNIVAEWFKHGKGMQTVVFAVSVAHSKEITRQFIEQGVPAEHIDGTMAPAVREAILGNRSKGLLGRMETGETRVVVNCNVLQEGWDLPICKVGILARPTASLALYLQQAGRILRPCNGLPAILIDPSGNVRKHDPPHWDRDYTLEDQKKDVLKKAVTTKSCRKCYAITESYRTSCPVCGARFANMSKGKGRQITELEGELEKLTAEERVEREAVQRVREMKAYFFRLCSVAAKSNLPPGWVAKRFAERFQRAIPGDWDPAVEISNARKRRHAMRSGA